MRSLQCRFLLLLLLLLASLCCCDAKKIKIFILAGQSNMFGFASMEHLLKLAETNETYATYMNPETGITRTNPLVQITDQQINLAGDLRVGFGLGSLRGLFGPEVGLGWTLGDALGEESAILLIKISKFSTSLAVDWRPPSAAAFSAPGEMYDRMMTKVQESLELLPEYFPNDYMDGYEISGFVWFQGWADSLERVYRNEYTSNLQHLIHDVRAEFDAPYLPIIIGELGQGGPSPTGIPEIEIMRSIQQTVVNGLDNFVALVPTGIYASERDVNYDALVHYWGHADTMIQIGNAFGRTMLNVMSQPAPPPPAPFATAPVAVPPVDLPFLHFPILAPPPTPTTSPQPSTSHIPSQPPSGSFLPSLHPSTSQVPTKIENRPLRARPKVHESQRDVPLIWH